MYENLYAEYDRNITKVNDFEEYPVEADGYGRATVIQAAEFDSIIQIRLPNGETAWTDRSLVKKVEE